jgi:hypothetical protein
MESSEYAFKCPIKGDGMQDEVVVGLPLHCGIDFGIGDRTYFDILEFTSSRIGKIRGEILAVLDRICEQIAMIGKRQGNEAASGHPTPDWAKYEAIVKLLARACSGVSERFQSVGLPQGRKP